MFDREKDRIVAQLMIQPKNSMFGGKLPQLLTELPESNRDSVIDAFLESARKSYKIEFFEYRKKLNEVRGFYIEELKIVQTGEAIKKDDRFNWR